MTTDDEATACEQTIWLQRVASDRDRFAFERLFRHFYPRLLGFMGGAGFSVREAEELAQECLLKVWLNAGSYQAQLGSVSAWVFAIARNARCDRLRKRKGLIEVVCQADVEAAGWGNDMTLAVEADRVLGALATLSPEQRAVLELTYLQGLTQAEISDRLDLPIGTVKSRVRLAVRNLRNKLGLE